MSVKTKDPNSDLDYFFDWSKFLGADTINTFTVTSSHADLVVKTNPPPWVVGGNIVYFWLTGGKAGEEYTLVCHIETNNNPPRKDDRTMRIVCKQK